MTIPAISTLPSAPSRTSSPATFNTDAEAFITALISMVTELNTAITNMNLDFSGTYLDGAWSSATGAKTAPKIYTHNDVVWLLHTNVSDITAETPSASNDAYYLPIGNLPVGEAVKQTLTTTTPTWTMSDGAAAVVDLQTTGGNTTITLAGEPAGTVVHYAFLRVIQDDSASGYTIGFSGATVQTEDGLGLPALSAGANDVDDFVLYSLDNGTNYTIKRVARNVS